MTFGVTQGVQLVTHQVEGGDIGRSIQKVPESSEVGVPRSTGHVTPQFEGPDLRSPPGGGGTRIHIPGSNKVGMLRSKGHVTPQFEGQDFGNLSKVYPSSKSQVQRSWHT